jgi:folate-dependent phosphoribosylglycinamide formyltransferase PurN
MKICWFTTGRDKEAFTLMRDVCQAIDQGSISGEVSLLFMNRDRHESEWADQIVDFAEKRAIPVELLSSKRFLEERGLKLAEGRELFDNAVRARIAKYPCDLIFLAGYMLIVSKVLHESQTVLNLHPSLPKAYKGKWEDVIRNTIEDGVRTFGAMIHMVDASLDEGAPVAYVKLELAGSEIDGLYNRSKNGDQEAKDRLFALMREKEFDLETPLIIKTLSLISTGDIRIVEKTVYYKGQPVPGGIDITGQIA